MYGHKKAEDMRSEERELPQLEMLGIWAMISERNLSNLQPMFIKKPRKLAALKSEKVEGGGVQMQR